MKTITITAILFLIAGLQTTPKDFRVSAVQESQVWIEGGLLDGLEEGMQGEIFYEISIAGQKKRLSGEGNALQGRRPQSMER